MRRQRRKDGTYGEFGPYCWYIHHVQDGRSRTIYPVKTDDPEAKLARKREERRSV